MTTTFSVFAAVTLPAEFYPHSPSQVRIDFFYVLPKAISVHGIKCINMKMQRMADDQHARDEFISERTS